MSCVIFTHRRILAELLRDALSREFGRPRVVTSAAEFASATRRGAVVALVDPGIPTDDVFEAVQRMRRANRAARALFFAEAAATGWITDALAAGASGFL